MLTYENPDLLLSSKHATTGVVAWTSPSNLALVKYWGKYGRQLPRNPSISFTLQQACTETRIQYQPKTQTDPGIALEFFFDGKPNTAFRARMLRFLESIQGIFPFLTQLELRIDSRNTFPHSTGIASSASAMSALALCLCSMEEAFFGQQEQTEFFRKASYIARLGSGSASRSVFPGAAIWGRADYPETSSNEYAIPYGDELHAVFRSFHDDILIVSQGAKAVSSSAGHALMDGHAYAEARYEQAHAHFKDILQALREGDLEQFGAITEREALTLHGLMMSSHTPYILMEPNSILLIRKVQAFRRETQIPLYFSLDAGPNLHLLYPDADAEAVGAFIRDELQPHCQDGQVLRDQVGAGPVKLMQENR